MLRLFALASTFAVASTFALSTALLPSAPAAAADGPLVITDQGEGWTRSHAREYYSTDQGSRIMPLAWMNALETADGEPFLHDALARYGYLPNPDSPAGLPLGFTSARAAGEDMFGMTCSACHTRELDIAGTRYRIDGGPAMADFQSFLEDIDTAVGSVLASDEAFAAFAERVRGNGETLREEVQAWHTRYATLMERSLPDPAWGPGRLDAITMIFNRLTGLDIGEGEDRMIPDNMARASAPTRYPFLWNAWRQDYTQWPAFAGNGNMLLGLARNLGQVYGVFGQFHPTPQRGIFINRNYLEHNSANFDGLNRLEELVWAMGPPKFPFVIDEALAKRGEAVWHRSAEDGGCNECHGVRPGVFRFPHSTWATAREDVGTDVHECEILARTVETGVLDGARIRVPLVADIALGEREAAADVLRAAVLGAIIQQKVPGGATAAINEGVAGGPGSAPLPEVTPELQTLRAAYGAAPPMGALTESVAAEPACVYEGRVLHGIWAAAPYLHNGSVPSLEQLLTPPDERTAEFKLGPRYDIDAVGLHREQDAFDYTLVTTGCDDRASGNSRCGHAYGTDLPADEKRALLEYLKTL